MGIVTIEQLVNIRPYFIVGAFVVAAIVTPPDVISQLMLALPMWLLFEIGLLAARAFRRPPARDDSGYRPPEEEEIERELDNVHAPDKGSNS